MRTLATAGRLAAALALAAVLLSPPAALWAQSAQEEAAAERPGWIGVGIQESLDCGARAGEGEAPEAVPLVRARDCRRILVTQAVFEDGPAAEAGMQPGDTLVAVDGQPVAERSGAVALGSLEPGRPVEVLVGREGGRETLRITPEPRPREHGPTPILTPGRPDAPSVFVRPGSLARAAAAAAEGTGPTEIRLRLSDGEFSGTLRVDEDGHVYLQSAPHELVRLKGVELRPPEVRAIRDSVLTEARRRLEEIRAERRPRPPVAPPSPEDAERIRMLGAEFLALTSELAGNLRGVDAGLLVLRVVPGTPAAHLGLRPGDVVVEAGGEPVAGAADLRSPFGGAARGDSVIVRWVRRGEAMRGALRRR